MKLFGNRKGAEHIAARKTEKKTGGLKRWQRVTIIVAAMLEEMISIGSATSKPSRKRGSTPLSAMPSTEAPTMTATPHAKMVA